jgi:hypothetical protein
MIRVDCSVQIKADFRWYADLKRTLYLSVPNDDFVVVDLAPALSLQTSGHVVTSWRGQRRPVARLYFFTDIPPLSDFYVVPWTEIIFATRVKLANGPSARVQSTRIQAS